MKVGKIKELCKKSGQIIKTEVVTDESILKGRPERVFVGSENAAYRLNPVYWGFHPEELADLWEISSKAQEKMFMDEDVRNLSLAEDERFKDNFTGEICVGTEGFSFTFCDVEWKVFYTEEKGKYLFIPAEWLKPVDFEDEETTFWLRGNYLGIKKGFYLEGEVLIPDIETLKEGLFSPDLPILYAALFKLCEISKAINEEKEIRGEN